MPVYDYKKYSDRSDADLHNRALAKEKELEFLLAKIKLPSWIDPKVIVLGCPDKRMISAYQSMFLKFLKKEVMLTVIDKTIDHLRGIKNVVKHDATTSFPNPPYDVVYAHVLLKFIETEKQWNVLENSYSSLSPNGIAIFTLDTEDYESRGAIQEDGWFSVPLEKWKNNLNTRGIKFSVFPFNFEQTMVGVEQNSIRGIKGSLLVLFKQ